MTVPKKISPITLYCFTFLCWKIAWEVFGGRTTMVSADQSEKEIQIG